jgi:hypothetical protein
MGLPSAGYWFSFCRPVELRRQAADWTARSKAQVSEGLIPWSKAHHWVDPDCARSAPGEACTFELLPSTDSASPMAEGIDAG